ncbi:LOB domain-containing protein 9 [Cardamine amara subsp. amara]|uniref:LOB domain-containing protein 9 n=1 Tax=Cardamine amara subsp. amara TaxID=228776 RepID=A0ABD1C601_CARAN
MNANRAPCAFCKTKNKRCPKNCEFAPYFPAERRASYESANKIFGSNKIKRMMMLAGEADKHMLATSILKEGDAWTNDSMRGGYGEIQNLLQQIELRRAYLRELEEKINDEKEKTRLHL